MTVRDCKVHAQGFLHLSCDSSAARYVCEGMRDLEALSGTRLCMVCSAAEAKQPQLDSSVSCLLL